MGGRGAKSSSSGKYAGRFASGTPEQLIQAEKNLLTYIEQEKKAIENSPARFSKDWSSHKQSHKNTLKELKLQLNELKKEKKRRKTQNKKGKSQ